MAVIAMYNDFATGGRELGRMLANRLGYEYVDKSLFQKIAEDLHVSEGTLKSFEMSREYKISNLFSNLFSKSYLQRIVGYDKGVIEEREYQDSLKHLILGVAQENDVVIIGRAAHYFLKDMDNCCRFRVIAPMPWRKEYAVEKLGVSADRAEATIQRRDTNQLWFHRSVCGEGFDDPYLFHLTLNTGLMPLEQAANIMTALVK